MGSVSFYNYSLICFDTLVIRRDHVEIHGTREVCPSFSISFQHPSNAVSDGIVERSIDRQKIMRSIFLCIPLLFLLLIHSLSREKEMNHWSINDVLYSNDFLWRNKRAFANPSLSIHLASSRPLLHSATRGWQICYVRHDWYQCLILLNEKGQEKQCTELFSVSDGKPHWYRPEFLVRSSFPADDLDAFPYVAHCLACHRIDAVIACRLWRETPTTLSHFPFMSKLYKQHVICRQNHPEIDLPGKESA